MANLTSREREIARLLAQGKRQSDIARELVISARTVEHHVANARRKVGASSAFELAVRVAVELKK